MVASHTAVPMGTAKWLVRATPPFYTLPLGKGQEQHMSPTQGQADIKGAAFAPAISKHLTAFLYGWLPLSDAAGIIIANGLTGRWHHHCKRPNCILSLLTAPCMLPTASSLLIAQLHLLCQLPPSDAFGIICYRTLLMPVSLL